MALSCDKKILWVHSINSANISRTSDIRGIAVRITVQFNSTLSRTHAPPANERERTAHEEISRTFTRLMSRQSWDASIVDGSLCAARLDPLPDEQHAHIALYQKYSQTSHLIWWPKHIADAYKTQTSEGDLWETALVNSSYPSLSCSPQTQRPLFTYPRKSMTSLFTRPKPIVQPSTTSASFLVPSSHRLRGRYIATSISQMMDFLSVLVGT